MGFEAKIQQKINAYRQTHPKVKMSDEQIVSILVKNGEIILSEDQKRSLFANNSKQNNNTGLKLEKTAKKPNPEKTIYLQSGRKVVYSRLSNGKTVMKYYGADGNRINPDYFKKVEGQISISADGNSYTVTKDGKKQTLKAKNPTQGAIDQNIAKLNNQEKALNKAKKEQGWIGKGWDWFKNTTGIGDGSDKAQQQIDAERKLLKQVKTGKISKKDFKEVTGQDYTKENLAKFKKGELSQAETKINGYKEGQDMATDMVGDMVSGIAAFTIYTAAIAATPLTGGTSLALGFGLATASGAAIKVGVKALDTVGTDKKYTWNDCKHDAATGAFSGGLAPVTAGLGGAVGKTVATKWGIQAVKTVGKEVAEEAAKGGVKSTLKAALANPAGYEYVGGTFAKRTTSMAAEMVTDGALGGAIDGGFRAGLDSDWDTDTMLEGAVEGGIGGALFAPVIGGGMKALGKGAQKAFGKDNVKIDANGNKVADEAPKKIEVEIKAEAAPQNNNIKGITTETPIQKQQQILKKLKTAQTREDFRRITQDIKNLPKTEEYQTVRQRLGGEYLQKYNEWKANQSESTRAIKNMVDIQNTSQSMFMDKQALELKKEFENLTNTKINENLQYLSEYDIKNFINLIQDSKTKNGDKIYSAIKELIQMQNVRNSIVWNVIDSCIEVDANQNKIFNQNAFELIKDIFKKSSGEMYSKSLTISEIAKSAVVEKLENGIYTKKFSEDNFLIAKLYKESDKYDKIVHIHFGELIDKNSGLIDIYKIEDEQARNYILEHLPSNIKKNWDRLSNEIFDINKLPSILKSFGFEEKNGFLIPNENLKLKIQDIRGINGSVYLDKMDVKTLSEMMNYGNHKEFWKQCSPEELITYFLRFKNMFDFRKSSTIDVYGEPFWNKIINNLKNVTISEEEKFSLNMFVGDGSDNINGALSNAKLGKSTYEPYLIWANNLKNLIDKFTIDKDIKMVRTERNLNRFENVVLSNGTNLSEILNNFASYKDNLSDINKVLNGYIINNERFMSATLPREDNSLPMTGLNWEINLKKGSKAIFRNNFTNVNLGELEYIIQCNSKIIINRIDVDFANRPILIADVVTE